MKCLVLLLPITSNDSLIWLYGSTMDKYNVTSLKMSQKAPVMYLDFVT